MAKDETTQYRGKEYNWNQLVKKLGIDKARVEAPELDPKYQEMVRTEGQAKGSVDYSHKYIDPSTLSAKGWAGMGSPEQIREGLDYMSTHGTGVIGALEHGEADIGKAIMGAGNLGLGSATGVPDPSKPGGGGKTTKPGGPSAATQQMQSEDQAIAQMYQGLLSQFQSAQNVVNPYISGANGAQAASGAQSLANSLAGGGVQGQNPNVAGVLSRDFQAQAAANTAGQQGIANAIGGMSQASQAQTNAAPYSQLLNALASKAQYNVVYGGAQPNVTQAPLYVQEALASANQLQPAGTSGATSVAPAAAPVTASGSAVPASGSNASNTGG